jgi:hypothetical protein
MNGANALSGHRSSRPALQLVADERLPKHMRLALCNVFLCCVEQGQDVWLVKLEGIDTPEAAEELRLHRLVIRAEVMHSH